MSAIATLPLPAAAAATLAGRARQDGTPLIEDGAVTFVWLGGEPVPTLVGDWNDWDADRGVPLERIGPGVHATRLAVPADAYLEYQLQHPDRRRPDPLNRAPFHNGVDGFNSCFWMPRAPRHGLDRRRRGVRAGTVTRHRVETEGLAVGTRRTVWLYRPAGSAVPLPLLVVLDGRDYLRRGRLDRVLDNLVADGRIDPLAAVFVDNGRSARPLEYGASDVTTAFLAGVVVPFAARELRLPLPWLPRGDLPSAEPWATVSAVAGLDPTVPGPVGILGASLGGLMALHAALRLPMLFGRVLAQSGAWEVWGGPSTTAELVRHAQPAPARIWMDCGRIEWLWDANERMAALLSERGYDVTYRPYQGGHNYRSWVQDVVAGLELLYGSAGAPAGE